MGLAEQQTVYKCKQTQQPSQILERFLNSALSLASAWVQRSAITHRVLRFGPGLRTPRGAELPTAGAWSLLCSSWCPGRQGRSRRLLLCVAPHCQLAARLLCWPGCLTREPDQGLSTGITKGELEMLRS